MTNLIVAVLDIIFYGASSVLAGLVMALPVLCGWNRVIAIIFGLSKITYFQAFLLYIAARALFGERKE